MLAYKVQFFYREKATKCTFVEYIFLHFHPHILYISLVIPKMKFSKRHFLQFSQMNRESYFLFEQKAKSSKSKCVFFLFFSPILSAQFNVPFMVLYLPPLTNNKKNKMAAVFFTRKKRIFV